MSKLLAIFLFFSLSQASHFMKNTPVSQIPHKIAEHRSTNSSWINNSLLNDMDYGVKVEDFFYLYWTVNTNSTITIALRWNTGAYFGFGIGTSAIGLDIVTAEIINEGIVITDRFTPGNQFPPPDDQQGCTNDISLLGYQMKDSEGFAIAKYIRALSSNDTACDNDISPNSTVYMAWAYEECNLMCYHGENVGVFYALFSDGTEGESDTETQTIIVVHSYALLVIWGFLVDIGIYLIKHKPYLRYSFLMHAGINGLIVSSTIALYALMYKQIYQGWNWTFSYWISNLVHFIFGTAILLFILIQTVLGILLKVKGSGPEGFLKKSHKNLGFCLYVFAKVEVFTGLFIYESLTLFWGYAAIYLIMLLLYKFCLIEKKENLI